MPPQRILNLTRHGAVSDRGGVWCLRLFRWSILNSRYLRCTRLCCKQTTYNVIYLRRCCDLAAEHYVIVWWSPTSIIYCRRRTNFKRAPTGTLLRHAGSRDPPSFLFARWSTHQCADDSDPASSVLSRRSFVPPVGSYLVGPRVELLLEPTSGDARGEVVAYPTFRLSKLARLQ